MRGLEKRVRISMLLIFSILICELCFNELPVKAFSFSTSDCEITSSVRIGISKVKQTVSGERLTSRSVAREMIRRSSRRVFSFSGRKESVGLSFVDFLPQIFHSTIFLQNHKICHNTSGHIELIRCIYRKDGKKGQTYEV